MPLHSKRSIFLCLKYPKNYQDNFLLKHSGHKELHDPHPHPPAEEPKPTRPISNSNSDRRVLRWIPKKPPAVVSATTQAESAPPPSPKPSMNLNSNLQTSPKGPRNLESPSLGSTRLPPLCSRCLGPGHSRKDCGNMVRCRTCFNYGHISVSCLSKSRSMLKFWPVSTPEGEGTTPSFINSGDQTLDASFSTLPHRPTTPIVKNPNSTAMANWACHPRPHVPEGFILEELMQRPPLHHEIYVTGCYT